MADQLADNAQATLAARSRRIVAAAVAAVAVVAYGIGFLSGRAWTVPGSTEFWTVAAQPIATLTAGTLALGAGALALYGVHLSSRRSRAATAAEIKQRDDAARIGELWKRFEWVVEQLSLQSPDDAAIDEDQAVDIVIGIRDSAEQYGDKHLSQMLDVYMGGQIHDLAIEVGLAAGIQPRVSG